MTGSRRGSAPRLEELLGDWSLIRWETRTVDGNRLLTEPFGPDAVGLLHLGADRVLHVQMMRRWRAPFSVPRTTAASNSAVPTEEIVAAFESFIAYAGRFEYRRLENFSDDNRSDGPFGELRTTVQTALIPDWVASVQTREVRLDGDRLQLRSLPRNLDGVRQVGALTWRRLSTLA